jgi:hypothetical protein
MRSGQPCGPVAQRSRNSSGPKARYILCRWRKPPVRRRINDDQARRADTTRHVSALRAWRSSNRAFDRGLSAPAEAVPGRRPLAQHAVGLHTGARRDRSRTETICGGRRGGPGKQRCAGAVSPPTRRSVPGLMEGLLTSTSRELVTVDGGPYSGSGRLPPT